MSLYLSVYLSVFLGDCNPHFQSLCNFKQYLIANFADKFYILASSNGTTTNICSHCDRAIPSSNIDLHYAHCSRNLEKCKICDDMIPRKHVEEHYLSTHAPVSCSLCSETMEPRVLAVHEGEKCPLRIVTCDYCEFPLPAIDLLEHQEVCGNRTEVCQLCNRYIRLRDRIAHEVTCNGVPDNPAETTRAREADRARDARRPPPQDFSTRKLVFTIAITGIAVVLGSLIFQVKIT